MAKRISTNSPEPGSRPPAHDPGPGESVPERLTHFSPYQVLKDAIKAVPAVKYALGVAGVVAAVAVIQAFSLGYRVAFFGAILMFVLMVLLVVFAKLTQTAQKHFVAPVVVLMWSFLLLAIATACLLFTSVFFRFPIDLRDWVKPAPAAQNTNQADSSLTAAPAKGTPSASPQSPGPLELGFEILVRHNGTQAFVPLHEGEEMASSVDDYCVLVSPAMSGYLYVLQQDATGQVQWLFPSNTSSGFSSGSNPVAGGKVLSVPSDPEKVLFLDSTLGTETIVVAFSATPRPELEKALHLEGKGSKASASAATQHLLESDRGAGGMRRVPASTVNLDAPEGKKIDGRVYRLPPPLELNQSSSDFLILKQSFRHVAPKQ